MHIYDRICKICGRTYQYHHWTDNNCPNKKGEFPPFLSTHFTEQEYSNVETITLKDFKEIIQECGWKCALTFLYHRVFWHETFVQHLMRGEHHVCKKV